MRFSLITACRNAESTIRDTIESVLGQTYPGIEYIVIDGASTDRTLSVVREYESRIAVIVSEPDTGIYNAINKGVRIATGDMVATINADDFYAASTVIEQVARTIGYAECLFADLDYVDPVDTSRVVRRWRSKPYRPGLFHTGWHPAHPTFFAQRSLFQRHGGFDESLSIAADYELMLRFIEAKRATSIYLPEVLVKMRDGGVSNRSLGNILRANIECYRSFRKNGLSISPLSLARKPLSKLFQLIH